MANWCQNTMMFENKEDVKRVLKLLAHPETEYSFEEVLPIPDGIRNSRAWKKEHWGTEWDVLNLTSNDRCIGFESGWDAPVGIYAALVREFPDMRVDIIWNEDGAGIAGRLLADGDGTFRISEGEYDCDIEDDDEWNRGWQEFLRETYERAERAERVTA